MNCDIHLFCEYEPYDRSRVEEGSSHVALADGEFPIPRDYPLFAALAGVRADADVAPLVAPRGIPHDLSRAVSARYFVPVIESERAVEWGVGEHFTLDDANEFVEEGRCIWLQQGMTRPMQAATHGFISHPDWHSAGWLRLEEIDAALSHARYDRETGSKEFQLLLRYLTSVEGTIGRLTRIVFWFDN